MSWSNACVSQFTALSDRGRSRGRIYDACGDNRPRPLSDEGEDEDEDEDDEEDDGDDDDGDDGDDDDR